MKKYFSALGRLLRVFFAAALAPFAVLFFSAASAVRRRRLRSRALEPGTVTEVSFDEALISEMEPVFGSESSIRLILAGAITSTRIGPSGVAVEDSDQLEFRIPLDPGLMVVLTALQGQGRRISGGMRFRSEPHDELISTEMLERVRFSPSGGGPEIMMGSDGDDL